MSPAVKQRSEPLLKKKKRKKRKVDTEVTEFVQKTGP